MVGPPWAHMEPELKSAPALAALQAPVPLLEPFQPSVPRLVSHW